MSKLCNACGAELLPGTQFCERCGNDVNIKTSSVGDVKGAETKIDGECMCGDSPDQTPRQFETMMMLLWQSIGLSALSGVIELFDVREYYPCGQFGVFLYECVSLVLSIWLTLAILKRKNWARVTFIVLTVLNIGMMLCLPFKIEGNAFCVFLYYALPVLDFCCVVLLFNKKVSHCFLKLPDGSKRAKIYWCVLVTSLFLSLFYSLYYQSVHEVEYVNNCAEAAAKGSKVAYQELIDHFEGCPDVSRWDIKRFVESKKTDGDGNNWRYRGPNPVLVCKTAKGATALLVKIKGCGKAFAIIGALLCGIGAWLKKTFIDGSNQK